MSGNPGVEERFRASLGAGLRHRDGVHEACGPADYHQEVFITFTWGKGSADIDMDMGKSFLRNWEGSDIFFYFIRLSTLTSMAFFHVIRNVFLHFRPKIV